MTKIITFLLSCLLVLSFASCDKNNVNNTSNTQNNNQNNSQGNGIQNAVQDGEQGNTAGNINNGGLLAFKDGRIYFGNISDPQAGLYSMNPDGSDKKKLSDDIAQYINVVGDRIYYSNGSNDNHIMTVKTDGSDYRFLTEDMSTVNSSSLRVVGNTIYFLGYSENVKGLYSIKIDGTDKKKISDHYPKAINIVDDLIYYINDESGNSDYKTYSIKTDGSDLKALTDDPSEINPSGIMVEGDKIYYRNGSAAVFSMNIDGSDHQQVTEDPPKAINILDGRIFYTNGNDDEKLYSINVDGSDNKKLCDDDVAEVFVADGRIYYLNRSDNRKLYSINTDGGDRKLVL